MEFVKKTLEHAQPHLEDAKQYELELQSQRIKTQQDYQLVEDELKREYDLKQQQLQQLEEKRLIALQQAEKLNEIQRVTTLAARSSSSSGSSSGSSSSLQMNELHPEDQKRLDYQNKHAKQSKINFNKKRKNFTTTTNDDSDLDLELDDALAELEKRRNQKNPNIKKFIDEKKQQQDSQEEKNEDEKKKKKKKKKINQKY